MRKFFFFTFCFSIVFVSNSNGVSLTKKPEYVRDLNQSICRLNSHPKSQGAKNKVKKTYDQAINFYQVEIDRILMGNDPLKWTKTLDVLETVNPDCRLHLFYRNFYFVVWLYFPVGNVV